MLFNSYIFIFVFLPLVLLGWHGCNHFGRYRLAQVFVVGMSLWFYGYFHYQYIALILASLAVNWTVSLGMKKWPDLRKLFGVGGILFNLGLLFYFKYYDFFVENVNLAFQTDWTLGNIVLPLGISFFTFQQISYVADRAWGRGQTEHYRLADYAMYVVYFPQLIAGPIVNHRDLVPQLWDENKRYLNWNHMLNGVRIFVLGLAKKVLLADELGKIVDYGYGNLEAMDSVGALLVMLAYTFQIYFDFSGYCDMAVGLGKMMNLELPLNFDMPYQAHSVQEFWRRWHITLSSFFTRYVYIPLGGNREGTWKRVRNTMVVFFLSGIWHGANWTFVLWGVMHGIIVSVESFWKEHTGKHGVIAWIRWFFTFSFVNLAWVLFRSDSIESALEFYRRLFSFTHTGYAVELAASTISYRNYIPYLLLNHIGGYSMTSRLYPAWMSLVLLLAAFLCTRKNVCTWVAERPAGRLEMWGLAVLFTLSVLTFSGVAIFLYFNF